MVRQSETSLLGRGGGVKWLFAAGLLAIPFDSVIGVAALGELGYELSFPFFALAIAAALLGSMRACERRLTASLALRIGLAGLAIVFLSYLFNFAEIDGGVFRERTAINKFATSLLVLLYGFALAWLAEQGEPDDYLPLVARFVSISAIVCILYLGIEILGEAGLLGGAYDVVDHLVHRRQADVVNPWDGSINEKVADRWDTRLRSVSFEPPSFGTYTGFAWPWVWYAAVKARPASRPLAMALLLAFTFALLFAASRTGLLMLAANIAVLVLLLTLYARPERTEALAAARLLLPVTLMLATAALAVWAATNQAEIVARVTQGESVSNISRLAFQAAGMTMFLEHPVLGVGLGQFGFHVAETIPDWAWISPEVRPMLTFPAAGWPNVYSMYGRLAAELGLVGLLAWAALWTVLAARLAALARAERAAGAPRITHHYPVAMNCIGVLAASFTTDTFRTPMIWIALGLACGLVAHGRQVSRASRPAVQMPG